MLRENVVFGPIRSRRLGASLGINLLPAEGKLCNFDCIYCECGWNADGRGDTRLPSREDVRTALADKLAALLKEGVTVDTLTFSGDGEPTLHPDFPAIVDDTLSLRDTFFPAAAVSVLSNATRIHLPAVREALRRIDNPILKLDAPDNERAERINRPAPGYDVARVTEAMQAFDGNFILQTMFLRCPGFDSSSPEVLAAWMDLVHRVNPREIMVYTIDRPTPQQGLGAFTEAEMRALVQPLADEGFRLRVTGPADLPNPDSSYRG